MYMDSHANLGYWSTDTCCSKWSLRTGAIIIGLLTMLSQALLTAVGVMAVIYCPVPIDNSTVATNMTVEDEDDTDIFPTITVTAIYRVERSVSSKECEDAGNSTVKAVNMTEVVPLVQCPLMPRPEVESLGITEDDTFTLMMGLFITYCGIYFILSFFVVIGSIKKTHQLLHGWVAFTGMHMVLIVGDLLFTLAYTTLVHMCTALAFFVIVLYTWAVVKSYRQTLINEKKFPAPSTVEDTNDYTVDGILMDQIPVQV